MKSAKKTKRPTPGKAIRKKPAAKKPSATASTEVKRLKTRIKKLKKLAADGKRVRLELEISENLYKNLVNTAQEMIWKCDQKGRFVFLNPAWEYTLGYTLKEMLGRPFTDFQKPEVAERDIKEFARHLAGGIIKGYETTHISKSGKEVVLLFNAMPLFDNNGNITGTQGTAVDITWSKEAEARLESQRTLLRQLLDERTLEVRIKNNAIESAIIGIAFTGDTGLLTDINPAFLKIWGYDKKEDVLGRSPAEFFETPEHAYEIIGHLQNDGFWAGHKTAIRKDRSTFPVEISASLVKDDHGKIVSMMATFSDITERVRVEDLLKQEKAFTENLIKTANVILVVLNIRGEAELINEIAEKTFEYSKEELLGKNLFETLVPKDKYPDVWAEFVKFRETNQIVETYTNPILSKSGVERIITWKNSALGHGGNAKTVSFGIDITESRRAQNELFKSLEQYQFVLRTTTDGFWQIDNHGRFLDVNERYCEIIGYSRDELLKMSIPDIEAIEIPEETAKRMQKIFETGRDLFETKHRRKDGTIIDIEISTTYNKDKGYFIVFARDISERKKAEEELKRLVDQTVRDSQTKSELLKEINHRVKNNLISIQGLLLAEKRYCPEENRVYVESVIDNLTNRIGGLVEVHQMLSEARWAPICINELSPRIVRRVVEAQSHDIRKIDIISSEDCVLVSPRQASNIAMIVSELATNTLKYADGTGRKLEIKLTSSKAESRIDFEYRDNGPGYPGDVIEGKRKSIGIDLIEKLVKGTLRGEVSFSNEDGAVTRIKIREEEITRT